MGFLAEFALVTFLVVLVLLPRILAIHWDFPEGPEETEYDYR